MSKLPDIDTLRELYYRGGFTYEQLGKRFGVSRQRVQQVFRKAGIKGRPPESCGIRPGYTPDFAQSLWQGRNINPYLPQVRRGTDT